MSKADRFCPYCGKLKEHEILEIEAYQTDNGDFRHVYEEYNYRWECKLCGQIFTTQEKERLDDYSNRKRAE